MKRHIGKLHLGGNTLEGEIPDIFDEFKDMSKFMLVPFIYKLISGKDPLLIWFLYPQ